MRYPTVLFDLDGTLIDSGAMILASYRHATRTVLEREVPDEVLAGFIGGGSIRDHMRALDEGLADELVRVYREHNEPLHDELQAFPGVEELLENLSAQGRKLGVVTAKRRRTVDLAFAVLPIEHYFDVVVTTESTERHKPHPDPVLHALTELGTTKEETAFVGDSPWDIEAGKAADVFTVAVAWGKIHSEERLLEAGADVLVHTPGELLGVL
ncbi:MAG TPA: HAD-IA family hydrolase [Gaiellaceae bacterium]|jgi:pyrophosphatase PpaX